MFVARLALDYRMKFRKDVVIDLVCYRRHGHNEADEPAATQPLMYQAIRKHATARQIYGERLEQDGLLGEGQVAAMVEDYRRGLDEGRPQARAFAGTTGNRHTVDWSRHLDGDWSEKPRHGGPAERLAALAQQLTDAARRISRCTRASRASSTTAGACTRTSCRSTGARPRRSATRRSSTDGFDVRLTGQDTARGTFFHRHAVLHDQATGRTIMPLEQIAGGQACVSASSIRRCRRRPCSASSTATRRPIPTRS